MKVLFLVPYPMGKSPSQRFRFEQYLDRLDAVGIGYQMNAFWSEKAWAGLYKAGRYVQKAFGFLQGALRRFAILGSLSRYEFVFIHREAMPLGPPIIEWLIARVWRKKIVYDFDDAIWLPNTSEENALASSLKWHSKVKSICRWSYKISCGNAYLAGYARRFNSSVVVNPSTIDTNGLHNPVHHPVRKNTTLTIGWTGSHSTLKYLELLVPVFQKLENIYPQLRLMVIANKKPDLPLTSLVAVPWQKSTEIEDLLQFDIGIMPLSDDVWAYGKCGFKALQYMALEIPAVVSPVGVNTTIIDAGVDGFLCSSEDEWLTRLKELITHPGMRSEIGRRGREKVIGHYSVESNTPLFLSLFE